LIKSAFAIEESLNIDKEREKEREREREMEREKEMEKKREKEREMKIEKQCYTLRTSPDLTPCDWRSPQTPFTSLLNEERVRRMRFGKCHECVRARCPSNIAAYIS
jgi:hypothetical protein